MKQRLTLIMLACIGLAATVVGRAVYLQLIRDPRLEAMAKRQFQAKVLVRPRRGQIFDRNGEALAINVETQSLAANPSKIQNRKTLARLLGKSLELPSSRLLERLSEKREFVWIKRHLSETELNRFKKWQIVDADGELIDGLWMVKESKRIYPHGELAAHTLGSVNLDSDGLEGTELWANEQLRGRVASVTAIRDALGRPTFMDADAAKDIRDGTNIALTIDASLQFAVEQELKAGIAKTGSRGGSAIVMDSVSGEILALANEPAFDPNKKNVPADRRRNRSFTDGYEPGSTLKPILLAGALSSGMRLHHQLWGERGSFTVQGKKISEAETHEKFEWLSLKRIIQVSSNVGAAKLALKLGAERYFNTLKVFGFGAKSGSGFPGEISGKVPALKEWKPLTTANVGFGQGVLVTPIQMLRAYAALANGGWLLQPTLIRSPADLKTSEPPRRILSQKILEEVNEALRAVVEKDGTGIKAALGGYQVAGKTGTAQVVDNTGHYSKTRYISSFIGYPIGVEPKVVIFVALDEPKGVYYASETAAPLFRNILAATANRFSLPAKQEIAPPVLSEKEKAADRLRWSLAKVADPQDVSTDLGVQFDGRNANGKMKWKIPSLKGLTAREALNALAGHPFKLEVRGMGVVAAQSPEGGTTLAEDGTIRLTLSEP